MDSGGQKIRCANDLHGDDRTACLFREQCDAAMQSPFIHRRRGNRSFRVNNDGIAAT